MRFQETAVSWNQTAKGKAQRLGIIVLTPCKYQPTMRTSLLLGQAENTERLPK